MLMGVENRDVSLLADKGMPGLVGSVTCTTGMLWTLVASASEARSCALFESRLVGDGVSISCVCVLSEDTLGPWTVRSSGFSSTSSITSRSSSVSMVS